LQFAVALIAGMLVVSGRPAGATAVWSITPSADVAGADATRLVGVSCTSIVSCFAVGYSTDGTGQSRAVIEHWDMQTWSLMANPRPLGSALNAVSCPLAGNCFAVGYVGSKTLIERWDGHRWSIVASPNPTNANRSQLSGVSCATRTSCVVVGSSSKSGSLARTLVERWDGHRWSIVASPNRPNGDNVLYGVSCPRTTECFAVGSGAFRTLVEHWKAGHWSISSSPNTNDNVNSLFEVSCPKSGFCFAAGNGTSVASGVGAASEPLLARWNGKRWSRVVPPLPPTDMGWTSFAAVSCPSPTTCVVVGTSGQVLASGSALQTATEQWDGTNWTVVPSPNPSGPGSANAELSSVTCLTKDKCVAVGAFDNDTRTLTERYA
jgi:hypothetical protein